MTKPAPITHPLAVSMQEAANMVGLSRSRMYELEQEQRIRTVKLGGRKLVIVASLHELLGLAA